jgi:hypothetical protein
VRARYLILGAAAGLAVAAAIAVTFASGRESSLGLDYAHSDLTPSSVQSFDGFAVYWLGPEFDGERLTAIHRRTGTVSALAPGKPDYVAMKYGDCEPSEEAGCPAPLEIQIWPACTRNRSSYQLAPDVDGAGPGEAIPYPRNDVTVRGVPASFYDNDRLLEVYTGDVTVSMFGGSRQQLLRAAFALQGANDEASAGALPKPVKGALTGEALCP